MHRSSKHVSLLNIRIDLGQSLVKEPFSIFSLVLQTKSCFISIEYNCMLQVNIRSIDEAVVIGAALSLSSSAFVLQVFFFQVSRNELIYSMFP
jgi:hypothetical protein